MTNFNFKTIENYTSTPTSTLPEENTFIDKTVATTIMTPTTTSEDIKKGENELTLNSNTLKLEPDDEIFLGNDKHKYKITHVDVNDEGFQNYNLIERFSNTVTFTIYPAAKQYYRTGTIVEKYTIQDKKIEFQIKQNNNKIILDWSRNNWINNTDNKIIYYIVVKYINNTGPFIYKYSDGDPEYKDQKVEYKVKSNVIYKYIIYAIDDHKNISDADSLKEIKLLNRKIITNENTDSIISNVLCNANGQHQIIDKSDCEKLSNRRDNNIIYATSKLNSNCLDPDKNIQCFNEDKYDDLMRNLSKTDSYNINFVN